MKYTIGDWGFLSWVKKGKRTNPPFPIGEISPIGDLKYPIVCIIPNWTFSSVSPLFTRILSVLLRSSAAGLVLAKPLPKLSVQGN